MFVSARTSPGSRSFYCQYLLIRLFSQLDCVVSAVLNSTCALTDTACICADATLQGQAQQCVVASCTIREQLSTSTTSSSLSLSTVTPVPGVNIVPNASARVATLNITNAQCGISSGHDHSWMPPMIFFIVLAGIIFVLRLVSRVVCHTRLWWDDFFNLLATVRSLVEHAQLPRAIAPNLSPVDHLDWLCRILCSVLRHRQLGPRHRNMGSASREHPDASDGTALPLPFLNPSA